jgi:UDP-N-acetylglucosamine transferase subunit ALG13
MIFVTVGTDMPFDRLVKQVDAWAVERGRNDVFAQIGEGGWKPRHIRFADFLQPPEFADHFRSASIIISHAGMGTILSALHYGKPILVMPKRASLREHRNEHQLATAQRMMEMANVNVAFDEIELREKLDRLEQLVPSRKIGTDASDSLINGLRAFIRDSTQK